MSWAGGSFDAALLGAVLVTSLVGSLHCAGMCGVFVAMAVGAGERGSRLRLQVLYHGGRLVGYITLGVIAGAVGQAVDLGAHTAGLHHTAAIVAAAMVLLIGIATALKELGVRLPRAPRFALAQLAFEKGARISQRVSAPGRALVIGLLTALLPCGWLYAFALVAAGTASPLFGGMVMMTFWIGTVPILAAVGQGAGSLRARLGPKARMAAALLVAALGAGILLRGFDADLSDVRTAMTVADDGSVDLTKAGEAPCPLCVTGESQ